MPPVSVLAKLRALLAREAPEQAATIRDALRQTAQTGKEHSVIGLAKEGGASAITRGLESSVTPNTFDLRHALRAPGNPAIVDFHTHPGAGFSIFETAPSRQDFNFYSSNYPSNKAGQETRALIAVPPTKDGMRRGTSYNFFATENPQKVFDPKMLDAARFELQRAGSKGAFRSIQDDPLFREYFDYGGDLGEILEDVSPITLLRYRAGQGLGRHELQLGNKQMTPSPESTDTELFRRLEEPTMEVLRSKKFKEGGAVTALRSAEMAEENRPFIGYRSAGRRPESQQDRRASADAPLSALRGAVSGVLGAPGDIESLIRMLPGFNEQTVLPTSEDVEKRLPMRELNQTPTGRAFTTAGQLGGGFYTGPGSPLRAIAALPSAVSRAGRDFALAGSPAYVVKPKGGNWLAGSVERVVDPMKTRVVGRDPAAQLRDLDASYAQNLEAGTAMNEGAFARERARLEPDIAMNRWLETKLGKYMRNEMATPEDPVRALAERGVLHYDPTPTGYNVSKQRIAAGFPEEGMGVSDLAKRYEARADTFYNELQASDLTRGYPETVDANPWLAKVPPETRVYELLGGVNQELGMQHLVDELKNAINPESGLPAALRLKYSDLEKVTVPQAVERVAKINDWRAAQKVEADMARAMNPATQVVKEYPEQGFKWVELRQPKETGKKVSVEKPEMDLPTGFDERQAREVAQDMAFDDGLEEGTQAFNDAVRGHMDAFARTKTVNMDESYKALEDALKYEGETMGHCVGGYCPDVVEGKSKIFSLRDKKGQPHVTIEVAPGPRIFDTGTPDGRPGPENIVQIKGKGNKAPKEDYLPAVQDFVRSGNWGQVSDLRNTGLQDVGQFPKRQEALGSRFVTEKELNDYLDKFGDEGFSHGGQVRGYAEGGEVSGANFPTDDFDPDRIDAIVGELHAMNAA